MEWGDGDRWRRFGSPGRHWRVANCWWLVLGCIRVDLSTIRSPLPGWQPL